MRLSRTERHPRGADAALQHLSRGLALRADFDHALTILASERDKTDAKKPFSVLSRGHFSQLRKSVGTPVFTADSVMNEE